MGQGHGAEFDRNAGGERWAAGDRGAAEEASVCGTARRTSSSHLPRCGILCVSFASAAVSGKQHDESAWSFQHPKGRAM